MADLPVVNAIEELQASNKDQRERLQKSLRAGLLNVVKSVDRLHDAFQLSLSLQREQMDVNARLAMAQLEAERERQRKEDTSKTRIEKEETPAEDGGFGVLGIAAILAGVAASLGALAVGFALELSKTINSVFFKRDSKFIKSLNSGFKLLTEDLDKFFKQIKDGTARRLARLQFRIDRDLRNLQKFFRPITRFFERIGASKIGQLVDRALIKPTVDAFKLIGQTFRDIKKLLGVADDVAKGTTTASKFFGSFLSIFEKIKPFIGVMGNVGRILGKLFFPFTIIMSIYDSVKGAIAGYEDEGFWGAFEGALTGLFNSIVGAPLDLLKDGVAWVLSKFGFDETSEVVSSFSFSDLFSKIIGGIFDGVKAVKDFVVSLFTIPEDATIAEMIGLGAAGIIDVLTAPINVAVNFFKGMFGLTNEELGGDEPFRLSLFVQDTLMMVWDKITGMFDGILNFDYSSLLPGWAKKLFGVEKSDTESEPSVTSDSEAVKPRTEVQSSEKITQLEEELAVLRRSMAIDQNRVNLFGRAAETETDVMKAASYSETAVAAQMNLEEALVRERVLQGKLIDEQSKLVAETNRGNGSPVAIRGGDTVNQPITTSNQQITVQSAGATRSKRSPQSRDVYADEQVMVW